MAGIKALLFSVLVVALLVIGILNVIIITKENKCEMTWMFEQPEYLKIPMPKAAIKKFPNYDLYVYGEGHYSRILSSMKLFGIPVLFIPGNAGSHKQARSLASVAFRRANDKVKRYHFNFFTVGFNEELSGLYGPHLQDQTEFVRLAIKKIFSLYKEAENPPSSIVLVGHSMGGMIARGLLTLPNFDPKLVNTIFMQASPNQAPVIALDPAISEYHERVNSYWRNHGNTTLSHITLVSSGGGEFDVMVRGGLTSLDGIVDEDRGLSTTTTHIPKAWVSTDHKCIVWCKQVVLAFVRALFDITDEHTKQITTDVSHRMSVFRHHFLHHPGTGGYVSQWPQTLQLDTKHDWTLMKDRVWKWEEEQVTKEMYLAIPLIDYEDIDHAVIVSNIVQDSWICVCTLEEGQKQCASCQDMSSQSRVLPPLYSNKKVVHLDLDTDAFSRATHVVIVVQPTDKPVEIIGEVYSKDKKHVSNSLPGFMEIVMAFPESVTKGALVLDLGDQASFYRVKLYNLNSVVKVYTAGLHTDKCTQSKPGEHAGSVMRFQVPWSNEDVYEYIKYGQSGNLSIKLQHIPPAPVLTPESFMTLDEPEETYDSVELLLHLDPTCHYKLSFSASFRGMLAQFVRFYGTLLPAYCVATLLMALTFQLKSLANEGKCPSVLECLWETKPYVVVPISLITQVIMQMSAVQPRLEKLGIPVPDIVTLENQGMTFRGAQLLLYLVALGITTLHAGVISLVIQILSRVLGPIFALLPSVVWSVAQLLVVLACLGAAGIAMTVCGSVAIFACYVVAFLQLIALCYLSRQSSAELTRRSQYHVVKVIFMLWMWLLILNSPSLIVWWKGVVETQTYQLPSTDPSRAVGASAAIIFLCLFLCISPLPARSSYRTVSILIHVTVTQLLVFGMVTLYRVSYFLLFALLLLAVDLALEKLKAIFTTRPKTE